MDERCISYEQGLTSDQVQTRVAKGQVNLDMGVTTKSIKQIVKDNVLTLFNLLNIVLALSLFFVGSFKNMLFMGVIVTNVLIGIYQEISAKRTIDKLSIISSQRVHVIREGEKRQIHINEIVMDDIVCLQRGEQIVSDSVVVEGKCFVNESLITGESDPICKESGDMLLSGSYLVSGECKAQVVHVGVENYASKISKDAKYVKKVNSEIMFTFKRIILFISFFIVPIGVMLLVRQTGVSTNTLQMAVEKTVAALVGMIPEGLVLLTSSVLAVSVVRLSKHKVMVQELYCIETLARVDVLCLDKTGTITEGTMELQDVVPFENKSEDDIKNAVSFLLAGLNDGNPVFMAVKENFTKSENAKILNSVAFSSEKKWSGVSTEVEGSYVMGAAEYVLDEEKYEMLKQKIQDMSKDNRVIVVVHSKKYICDDELPDEMEILGFLLFQDKIRKNARETLEYFKQQDVKLKIISGDNPITVSTIAERVGFDGADKYIDATKLETDDDIFEAVDKYNIFGRVTPQQKKKLVNALQEKGHTVAMTGDGVNDVLALKEADCSIAMAEGSDAARNVSQLVLLDSDFSSMVEVVKEGRRSINNIQRSSSLFLVKTIYSFLLAVIFMFLKVQYPFMPIQLTLTSVLTIGVPSFILALEPNHDRVKGHFFSNVLRKAVPGALTIVFNIILIMTLRDIFSISAPQVSTVSVLLTGFSGLMLLFQVCRPFNALRRVLFYGMCLGFVIAFVFFRNLFSLSDLTLDMILMLGVLMFIALIIFKLMTFLFNDFNFLNQKIELKE